MARGNLAGQVEAARLRCLARLYPDAYFFSCLFHRD